MNLSSSVWIFMIVVGAAIVAIGNIQFNLARDKEKSAGASEKALSMVAKESERNLGKLSAFRSAMANNEVTIEGFETAAWNVVSASGLLVQTETETLQEITEAYYLVELANKYHDQIVDMSMGIASALGGVQTSRTKYLQLLANTITRLEPRLKAIVDRQKAKT